MQTKNTKIHLEIQPRNTKIHLEIYFCKTVRLLGGMGCDARKLEMGVGHYMFQSLCESNDGGRHGLFESGLWSIFP